MALQLQGHIHPESSFATISQWESIATEFLALQRKGVDTRGGKIANNPKLAQLVARWFSFQLHVETKRFAPQVTTKNVLDFIEDFVNHKVWGLRKEFGAYLPNIDQVKIAYFYSRFDIEPFVLMDDDFVKSLYGTTEHKVTTMRFTTLQNLEKLQKRIEEGTAYDISTFTKQWKPFFKKESNVLAKIEGNLVAAFRSDVKSIVTDKGNKAASMERLAYPGEGDNLCTSLDTLTHTLDCPGDATQLWNEYIINPTKIIKHKQLNRY